MVRFLHKIFTLPFFLFSICYLFSMPASSAPGELDLTFGSGGKVVTSDFRPDPFASSSADEVVIQPDGKILTAGVTSELAGTFYRSFLIMARYNPDGSLDATFGTGGKVTSEIGTPQIEVYALALQTDGKILVGGTSFLGNPVGENRGLNFTLVRFNSNGTTDTTFGGGNGYATTDFSGGTTNDDGIYSIVVQPDGKIAVSGWSRQGSLRDFALARYNADGSPDTLFDGDGKLFTSFSPSDDEAHALILQTDGKLIAAGYALGTGFDFALARYNFDGSLDNSFDADGKVLLDFNGSTDIGRDAVLEPNGKITVAGNTRIESANNNFAVARFNSDGSVDTTFDSDGKNSVDFFGLHDIAYSLVRQVNGKYVLGGYAATPTSSQWDFALARFNQNGAIDAAFGTAGKTTTTFGNFNGGDFIRSLALQTDGKIVAAGGGVIQPNSSTKMALARYQGDAPVNALRGVLDFDGDAKSDIGIFRPDSGAWWITASSSGVTSAVQFGSSTDKLTPNDYTGDGKTDIAFWRGSTGEWFILRSEDYSFYGFQFGISGDIAAPGDFDGDNKWDAAVYRPSNGVWYILRSTGGVTIRQFGIEEDKPVIADYDGDGRDDIAIYRPSTAVWWITRSSTNAVTAVQFGQTSDKTVQGDYTGDGKADIAFFRPSNGYWYILRSENNSFYAFPFGVSEDIPVPGDYDGDGKSDAAVFRLSNSTWYLQRSTGGFTAIGFGATGDHPVPNSYVRN